ncbi:MAG: hypothetical protein ABI644_15130 [Arenimonas sp.]
MAKKRHVEEPYWAPLPRQAMSGAQSAAIIFRNLIPVACVLLFGASALEFLLLSVFSLSITIVCIGVTGVAVSTKIEEANAGKLNAVSAWISLALIGLVGSLLLTALFGWVIALFASFTKNGIFTPTLLWSALAIAVSALSESYRQYRADRYAGLSESLRQQRDQPIVLGHVLSAGLIFIMSGELLNMGRIGMVIMTIAVTALFIFRDLRPDLMRELTRPSNKPPKGK